MAGQTGLADSYDIPQYVGEMFKVTPAITPFTSMIGGLTGGRSSKTKKFTWQTVDNATAAQPSISETSAAAGQTAAHRTPSQLSNVHQIHQYDLDMTYRKLSTQDEISGVSILGDQPVQDPMVFQQMLTMERAARDVEYSFLQGAFADVTDVDTATTTRGLKNAISTNTVAAGGSVVTRPMLQELFREMATSLAPFRNMVVFANAFNKQAITDIYGYAPDSRNVGGLNIRTIETDFFEAGIVYAPLMPTDEIYVVDLSVCAPHFLPHPDKGHVFWENKAAPGASEKWQLYFDIGLEYGPEQWHGSITGTATSS